MTGRLRPIAPGSSAHIIAPSGPVPMERFDRGLRVLRRHLQLETKICGNLLEQDGYLAGADGPRLAALHAALGDPHADLVLCARGGYGATRLLGALDPERLKHNPKTIVGFSDITALLCWAWTRAGLASVHGPVVTQLSTLQDEDVMRLLDLLQGELPTPLVAEEGTVVHGGQVEGRLFAGNLEVLRALIGTRYLPDFQGAILAIEEIAERPYRIDRTLTHFLSSGAFRGLRGVIVGQLIDCEEPEGGHVGPSAHDVVVERLSTLGVPVVTGFTFGHDKHRNAALPFGTMARLDADNCTLSFLETLQEATLPTPPGD